MLDIRKSFSYLAHIMLFMAEHSSKLRRLREEAGLSLRELARQIDEHPSNVSYWEREGRVPRSDVLAPIAKALGVSVEELLGARPPRRRAPVGRARQMFEKVSELPRSRQKKILDVVDALLAQSSGGQ